MADWRDQAIAAVVKDIVRPVLQRAVAERRERQMSISDILKQVMSIEDARFGLMIIGMAVVVEDLIGEDWARFADIRLGLPPVTPGGPA
jgi:hypothetical protein